MPRSKKPQQEKPAKFRLVPIQANASAPWLPLECSKPDGAALKALFRGEATADQQVRAMEYILEILCDRHGMSFRSGPDGERETAFAEGRRFVGNQIVRLTKIPLSKIKDTPNG